MTEFAKEVTAITIENELKRSYLDYAMSVIVGRALPDVRDGLKPVHRRVLYAMHESNNDWNKAHKKSARIVGETMGKYHPHGDSAIYDTIVRMAQPFSMRHVLIDGQGNFGSIDGDSAAAMRYTEIRMAKITHSLMADLEKETVDFVPNYDETEFSPAVLPTRVPNLLVNGGSGIAVGMATNIPPHNLGEIIDATLAMIDNANISVDELIRYVPGPDFPTAGIISGRAGILDAYKTGRGRIYIRGRVDVESNEKNGKDSVIINELPYQVNKAKLIEKVAELVKDKKLEGITALRDESDKSGMRVVIELRRGEIADVVINNLYKQTQLQTVFGINMVALVDGQPKLINLHQALSCFLKHRREVVTRRTIFELRKARNRAHLLEGLGIALANIDEMIQLIKTSSTPALAKEKLLSKTWAAGLVQEMLQSAGDDAARPEDLAVEFGLHQGDYRLSPIQAQAILDLRLHRLTGLEQEKIINEYKGLIDLIEELLSILSTPQKLMTVIRNELTDIKTQFTNPRRTEITNSQHDLSVEDLIPNESVVVTLSHAGYFKSQSLDLYQAQRRGGRGKSATQVKDEDFVQNLVIAKTHDTILCFSSRGKVYWLKVYQIPVAGRNSRGKPIVNLLPLEAHEKITALLPLQTDEAHKHVFMATSAGTVKKVAIDAFSRQRSSGLIAINLNEEEELIGVQLTSGDDDVLLFSNNGKGIRFHESHVREMGRSAHGVRGIRLKEGQQVMSLVIANPAGSILTATKNGYGKRTPVDEYRLSMRGGQGVISIQVSERNGDVVSAIQVVPGTEVMLISDQGTLVRTRVDEISRVSRNTQGVKLINLGKTEHLAGLQHIAEIEALAEPKEQEEKNNDETDS